MSNVKSIITSVSGFLLLSLSSVAQPSIGGFNVYYGHLHNHCKISDGLQTPDYAYNYAKTTGDLDFFSLSDHSPAIIPEEWTAMKVAADKYNEPGVFTAFRGFEWTNDDQGHITVINSDDCLVTAPPANTFTDLCYWLNKHECVAFFNHPGYYDANGLEFHHFSSTRCDKIVGMELWNKKQRFERYYYNDGYYQDDGNSGWFDEALTRGWHVGASGSEDNHFATWGTRSEARMAVLASANNRVEIMNALKARRFFTTYDKNLAISCKINGYEMGSTISGGSYKIVIRASDADHEIFTHVELLRNGFVINSWTPGSANPAISASLDCLDGEYYYIRVMEADGDEAITSPIWISDGDADRYPVAAIGGRGNIGIQTFVYDFSSGYEGWSGDFADYPTSDSVFYELEFTRTTLPAPLDTSKNALMISGSNHSDDLFMFIKKKITGLSPNKTYKLLIDIELASDAPTHAIGIGGAPGESVFLKAGASLVEPKKVNTEGFYLMNIDKSNQASPGLDMDTLGHVGVSDTTSVFSLINRSNAAHPFKISTNDDGTVWVCIGTDSGFEGTTTLYYNKITLTFDYATGKDDPPAVNPTILFPNPAKEMLYIRSENKDIRSIEVINSIGQTIHKVGNSDRISLKNIPTGTYFVQVTFADNSHFTKLIVIE
jgi:hypothetical protein